MISSTVSKTVSKSFRSPDSSQSLSARGENEVLAGISLHHWGNLSVVNNRKLACSPVLSSLARRIRKVFSFADALGHLAYLFRARLDSAVARTCSHEEVAGDATRQHDAAAHPLPFAHSLPWFCLPVVAVACMAARLNAR